MFFKPSKWKCLKVKVPEESSYPLHVVLQELLWHFISNSKYFHAIQYTTIKNDDFFEMYTKIKERYIFGVNQRPDKDMKMVNLKMSLIAALPPLGYGHFPTQVPPHLDQSVSGNKCWKYTHRLFIIVCDKFNRSFKTWKTGLFGGFFTWWKYVDASMERICWNLSTHAALTITIITGLKTLLMQSTVWKTNLLFGMSIENIYNTLCDWRKQTWNFSQASQAALV